MQNKNFAERLLRWFDLHGRKDLPWQQPRSLYRVWVSEIMLQQTQVATVIPYFERFMERFPDLESLASAPQDELLHYWSGLGYYARARNLHKSAQIICSEFGGVFPEQYEQLLALPGIGPSTAGAILAQALEQKHAILDGNVKRLLARYYAVEGWTGQPSVQKILWQYARRNTPDSRLADYTQAIMDLGATICKRGRPDCEHCPLREDCAALHEGKTRQLPTPRPKKSLPVKSARMLLLMRDQHEVMLQRRPPSGIWGGLWSFPEIDLQEDIARYCQQQWQFDIQIMQQADPIRHSFSHYHFDISPCIIQVKNPDHCVMEADSIVWYNTAQPDRRGLAAPVKQLLQQIAQQGGCKTFEESQ